MKTYTAAAGLALATQGQFTEEYGEAMATAETNEMNTDEYGNVLMSMPQGSGQDHLLWSWEEIITKQLEEVSDAEWDIIEWTQAVEDHLEDLEQAWSTVSGETGINSKNCQLWRNEEMNLYYQCTQDDINNYQLDHYGGEKRSFPRWLDEFIYCNTRLAKHAVCPNETDAWYANTWTWGSSTDDIIIEPTPDINIGPFYDSEYWVVNDVYLNWWDAESYCVGWGGHLFTDSNQGSHDILTGLYADEAWNTNWYWIGGTQPDSVTWTWSDGTPFMQTFWNVNEPNNWDNNEDCMGIGYYGNTEWYDDGCWKEYRFICEKQVEYWY